MRFRFLDKVNRFKAQALSYQTSGLTSRRSCKCSFCFAAARRQKPEQFSQGKIQRPVGDSWVYRSFRAQMIRRSLTAAETPPLRSIPLLPARFSLLQLRESNLVTHTRLGLALSGLKFQQHVTVLLLVARWHWGAWKCKCFSGCIVKGISSRMGNVFDRNE